VVALRERFGVSERRACRVAGQHRATQRRPRPVRPDHEARLGNRLRELARAHPRWGWRMVWRVLGREAGQPWTGINHQRVQRLWREEGLRRPVRTRKRRRVATGTAERLGAERPNHVWAIDLEFDETADGRRLKLANIVDEHTREALALRVGRSCTADDLVNVLNDLVADRGAPAHLRADNGPELIAWALREWCRLSGAQTCYIEPGSPWENPTSSPSTAGSATSCSTSRNSPASPSPRSWSRPGGSRTTPTGLTPPSTGSPRPSTRPPGPAPPNPHSHSEWTTNRDPVTAVPALAITLDA
jgi:putative transposase